MLNLVRVGRPQFLIAGLALYVFGALVAIRLGAPFSLAHLLLGYLVVLPAQLSVHFSNDYFDTATDLPGRGTPFSGGSGILLEHPELRAPALRIAIALIGCSLGMGLLFVRSAAHPYWTFGFVILGNLIGWCYSAPPLRLVCRGLGEAAYTFNGGFLIPSIGYLALKGIPDPAGAPFLVPLLLYGLASILSVEIPDMEADRLAGKQTWVARRGRGFGFYALGACLLAATLYFFTFPLLVPGRVLVEFYPLGLLSLLPLGAGMCAWMRKPRQRKPAARMAIRIVLALVVFSILADGYLMYLVAG